MITPKPDPGDEVELPAETITTVWFAPDIGIVKYHQKSGHILLGLIFLGLIQENEFEPNVIEKLLPKTERTFQLREYVTIHLMEL